MEIQEKRAEEKEEEDAVELRVKGLREETRDSRDKKMEKKRAGCEEASRVVKKSLAWEGTMQH